MTTIPTARVSIEPPTYDHAKIRILIWAAFILLTIWLVVACLWSSFLIRWIGIPIWILLVATSAYYAHLVITRSRLGLGPFVGLFLIWANATAAAWAFGGWELGLTVLLAMAGHLFFAYSWCTSVTRFMEITRPRIKVALFFLALALPYCTFLLPLGLFLVWGGLDLKAPLWFLAGLGISVFSGSIPIGFLYINWNARKKAAMVLGPNSSGITNDVIA